MAGEAYPVAAKDLGAVLVDDADVARRLDPSLTVHLNGHALVARDGDAHRAALSYAMVLQVHDARCCHLYGTKDGNHFQDLVVDGGRIKDIIFFASSPKV